MSVPQRAVRSAVLAASIATAVQFAACSGGGGGGGGDGGNAGGGMDAESTAAFQAQVDAIGAAQAASSDVQQLAAVNPGPGLASAVAAKLRTHPQVANVEPFDGSLVVTTAKGAVFNVRLADEVLKFDASGAAAPGASDGRRVRAPARPPSPSTDAATGLPGPLVCEDAHVPYSNKACVLYAFNRDFVPLSGGPGAQANMLAEAVVSLTLSGFTVETYPLDAVASLAKLHADLPNCGVVLIASHGGWGRSMKKLPGESIRTPGNMIATEVLFEYNQRELLDAFKGDALAYFGIGTVRSRTGVFLELAPAFFATTYENTLVYAQACHSDYWPSAPGAGAVRLRDAFLQNGAAVFLGWDKKATSDIGFPAASMFFELLSPHDAQVGAFTLDVVGGSARATVSPAKAGVRFILTKSTGGVLTQALSAPTDAAGAVTLGPVGGASAGQANPEWVTVAAGNGDNLANVYQALQDMASLHVVDKDMFDNESVPIDHLKIGTNFDRYFNLSCTNHKLTQTARAGSSGGGDGCAANQERCPVPSGGSWCCPPTWHCRSSDGYCIQCPSDRGGPYCPTTDECCWNGQHCGADGHCAW